MSKDQPTPRTDAMIADHGGMANWHWHDFARQLERELAERTEERDEALGAVRVERACRELAALRSCQGPLGFVIATEMNGVMCVSDPAYRTRESAEADAELPRARGIKSEVLGCYREAPLSPQAAPRSTYRCGTCGVECLAAETAGAPVSHSAPPERPEDQDFSIFAEANAMTEAAVSARATPASPAESASLKEKL